MTTFSGVLVSTSAAEFMLDLSKGEWPRETGGALVGFETEQVVFVTHATGPGPAAEHRRTNFRRDGMFTQKAVDRIFEETSGGSDYVGEWHSHPAPVGPSATDVSAMAWISRNPAYRRPEPILLITQRTKWRKWRLLAFRWTDGSLRSIAVQVRAPEDLVWN